MVFLGIPCHQDPGFSHPTNEASAPRVPLKGGPGGFMWSGPGLAGRCSSPFEALLVLEYLHPGRLTWNLRIHPWKGKSHIPIHHVQVLPGCTLNFKGGGRNDMVDWWFLGTWGVYLVYRWCPAQSRCLDEPAFLLKWMVDGISIWNDLILVMTCNWTHQNIVISWTSVPFLKPAGADCQTIYVLTTNY